MPRLKEGTSLWRAIKEMANNQTEPGHPASMSVVQMATAEETFDIPEQQDANSSNTPTTHISQRVTRSGSGHGGTSPWVRRTTRNVNQVSRDQVLTEEEQLEATLAESLAQDSAMPAQKDPVKQTRKRPSKSRGLLTSRKAQEALSRLPGQHTALKLPKLRITNDRILVVREVDSLAQSLDTDEPLDAFDLEQAKDLERQQQLLSLSMLEGQEGYIPPVQGEHESAMRSTLVHDVDNDDFTAAFILREMANSDITADPASMDFVQQLMNPAAPGTTLESTNLAKEETPREVIPLRRSTRKKTAAAPGAGNSSSKAIESEQPAPEPLKLDEGEGFMPSAANDFKFKYDSPSGLQAKELDALLKPPSRPKAFPADLAGEKAFGHKSYKGFGSRPKENAANDRVREMELEHARTQQDVDMAMEQEDMWSELWGVNEWEE
ncbi:uncharacterized protein J4E78_000919 [Alternaria triticimaculans]|uniref:uncharacterized protein n=1 Tax=Alternaria triticimaculans TaxID=297637 RepID=UPI0020C402F7|nr:uncharacterized protein J4E78_000919 [Alternaria triticimaculans]KAI4672418.1 hypothetical protein J4E78_000919 [Alternaria triticimaculans]